MDARKQNASNTADREIVIERIFDAPRELVRKAWTEPEHVARWWGPDGFSTTIEKMDFSVGGVWKHVMHGPDGKDYPNSSVFREIVKPERIVFSLGGGREGGPGAHFLSTWTFEALGDKTQVTMPLLFDTTEERDFVIREFGAYEGGMQTFARLADYLPKMAA
ncbi:MAG: SRPBCC family protein [Gallionella sp.]